MEAVLGLSAVVAEYYAATGKKEGLTEADVITSAARRRVKDIERSIVHYGDTTLFIADHCRPRPTRRASSSWPLTCVACARRSARWRRG